MAASPVSSRSVAEIGTPMFTPGGVFSGTVRPSESANVGSAAWTGLPAGSRPPASAARASAPSSASVKTGALCFIDFPHESRSRRLVCLESIL